MIENEYYEGSKVIPKYVDGNMYLVENQDYQKRNPMTHLKPKKKKRKK